MLTKINAIALATALTLGTACTVLAAPDTDQKGGYRELGPGGVAQQGVNPVDHRSLVACHKGSKTYRGKDGKRHSCGA
jgi:uncharacterized membrane protein